MTEIELHGLRELGGEPEWIAGEGVDGEHVEVLGGSRSSDRRASPLTTCTWHWQSARKVKLARRAGVRYAEAPGG